MTPPAEMQVASSRKPRLSRRQRIDRIVRRAVRRAVCECGESRPLQSAARSGGQPV